MASKNGTKKSATRRKPAAKTSAARRASPPRSDGKRSDGKRKTKTARTAKPKPTPKPNGSRKNRNGAAAARASAETARLLRRKPEVTSYDTYGYALESEEDYFVAPTRGKAYGRCGGRSIRSLMEKRICDRLAQLGVAHSHRPRRYEVRVDGGRIAAYSPCIVLRGRGREGKTAIIEVLAERDDLHARKVAAFRQLYETEFYVIFAAPGLVFDDMPPATYDEAVLPSEVGSLVARLAE